ncbi:hypothetical protein K7B10_22690, partial [Streptomyces flavotricini]
MDYAYSMLLRASNSSATISTNCMLKHLPSDVEAIVRRAPWARGLRVLDVVEGLELLGHDLDE